MLLGQGWAAVPKTSSNACSHSRGHTKREANSNSSKNVWYEGCKENKLYYYIEGKPQFPQVASDAVFQRKGSNYDNA